MGYTTLTGTAITPLILSGCVYEVVNKMTAAVKHSGQKI